MTLRDKYRALLGAFSQQDSGIWSGKVLDNYLLNKNHTGIDSSGYITQSVYVKLFCLPIPKGASNIIIRSDFNMNPFGVSATENGVSNILNTSKVDNVESLTLSNDRLVFQRTIPSEYDYFFFCIRPKNNSQPLDNLTFEFSKNSGGGY